jgi:hypothetical protein
MDMQKQIDAMAEELAVQRNILGARAMQLAVANAQLRADLEAANKRIAELEKPA